MVVADDKPEKIQQTRYDPFSGDPISVYHLRLPKSVAERAKQAAGDQRRSLNNTIVLALEDWLKRVGY